MANPSFRRFSALTKNQSALFRRHTFDVDIVSPIGNFSSLNSDFVPVSFTTPGRQIGTDEKTIWGPVYNVPYSRIYSGDFEITSYYNTKYHYFVREWMDYIFSLENEQGTQRTDKVRYYDDIIGRIEISVYPEAVNLQNGDSVSGSAFITLYEVFPITINGLDLDIGAQNELQTITTAFSFREIRTSLPNF